MTNALRIVVGGRGADVDLPAAPGLVAVVDTPALVVQAGAGAHRVRRPDGAHVVVVGHVAGRREADGRLDADGAAGALERERVAELAGTLEGRFLAIEIGADGRCEIRADRFGQRDLYYQRMGDTVILATGLDLLPVARRGAPPNQAAYAHALTVYGFRPPKRHTFYEGVRRMGVDEFIRIENGRVELLERPFVPRATRPYGDSDLEDYADALLEGIRARASESQNVVLLSSGWDSTAILACLVHLFGPRKVRAVTGRMVYADRSGVINQFEIDRARKMCEFYGVELGVVDFDYRRTAPEQIERVQPALRSQQLAGITALNHWILSEFAARSGSRDDVIFAGEMSDGAHNLGFSQYATYFHPNVEFREYFDKMPGYLHGPTFLEQLHRDTFADDPIYRLIRGRVGDAVFDERAPDAAGRAQQIMASCLLRGVRVPLWSLRNTRLLTSRGRELFTEEIENGYLGPAARGASAGTLYAWILHLYNSLHWQGSTVATIPVTAELHGRRTALPFHDGRLQDFLAAMPETWGRTLDLRPTKYPLKWMLANRVSYPMHLQAGPHSYLYDIDPTFNHSAEALYGSSMREYFVGQLRRREYENWLSPEVFDLGYVGGFVSRYLDGVEVRGAEMNDLWALCVLTMTGRYEAE